MTFLHCVMDKILEPEGTGKFFIPYYANRSSASLSFILIKPGHIAFQL